MKDHRKERAEARKRFTGRNKERKSKTYKRRKNQKGEAFT